ncbi:TetR family transcriptional regulator [Arthrobacter sp. ATA002]|uniref:TetR family transcriptional regulator n=1 Tax=Arthrobacter sp. ATA002 TaxID=2991715 RepID=UPI002E36731C|nr:TetR family transcriptional regulator [Arthrobacter sp. ATA002]
MVVRIPAGGARVRMTGVQRRAQLIDVARGLFALRGLDGATIEDIATAAGVSKPVVYEHFGSKEALYGEVVDAEFDRLLAVITEALSADAGPRILIERAAYALLDYIENHTDGFRILVRDAPPSQPEGTFASLLSRITGHVEHILAKEFGNRGLSAEVGGMYAQMLVGMVAMTGQWWLDARTPDKTTVAAHLVNLSWNGLTGLQKDPQLRQMDPANPPAPSEGVNPKPEAVLPEAASAAAAPLDSDAPVVLTLSAVLVRDPAGRILLVRKRGTTKFMQPGGKLEPGESFSAAAAREMKEEIGLDVQESDLESLGDWYGPAANEDNTFINAGLFAYSLPNTGGAPGAGAVAAAEIEELLWTDPAQALVRDDISPLLRDHILPQLLAEA